MISSLTAGSYSAKLLRQSTVFFRRARMTSVQEPKEVCLPVPWGHVSGKAWGDPANKPVLALHGWLDNAGSFDRLAPLLSSSMYVVAIDWPGHGLSSHRPVGVVYDASHYVMDIKFIVDALCWEKFSILAHSMGAGASTWFAGAVPDMVDRLVLLDGLCFSSYPKEELPVKFGEGLKNLHKLGYVDRKTYPTLEAAVDRMMEGHKSLDPILVEKRHCVEDLCVRGSKQVDDGSYQFTRDVRLNLPSLYRVSNQVNAAFLQAVKCPTLIVLADTHNPSAVWFDKLLALATDLAKEDQFHLVRVPGGHHVHMYNPHVLLPHITSFLAPPHTDNKL